jgi:hypothetical protein
MPVRECVRTWRARPQREQANGVYVPATTTKIIEWSSRRIHRRAVGERHATQ